MLAIKPPFSPPAARQLSPSKDFTNALCQPSRASAGDHAYDSKMRNIASVAKTAARSRVPTLNPDGISVKGRTYIYAPKGEALEYSALAANPYRGCGHKCAFCFVPRQPYLPAEYPNQLRVPQHN